MSTTTNSRVNSNILNRRPTALPSANKEKCTREGGGGGESELPLVATTLVLTDHVPGCDGSSPACGEGVSKSEEEFRGLLEPESHLPVLPTRRRQWRKVYLTLTLSVLLGLVSGTLYGYGRYSMDLKTALDLTHFQLQSLGILLDTGNFIGRPFIGYIYDHYGPRVSCLFGALIVFVSFGTIHLMISGDIPNTMWGWWNLLCLSFFSVGVGSGLGYTAALGSTTKTLQSVPQHRSLGVGIVATGYGFCSTLIGLSYNALGGLNRFFLFWAVLVAAVNLLGAMVFENELSGGGSTAARTNQEYGDDTETVGMAKTRLGGDEEQHMVPSNGPEGKRDGVRSEKRNSLSNEEGPLAVVKNEPNTTTPTMMPQPKWAALRYLDFWILFAVFGCCTGCGLFVINNLSTMVQSLRGDPSLTSRLVIWFSIFNCSGRIPMGYLADYNNVNKLALFSLSSAAIAIAMFCSALSSMEYATSCLVVTALTVAVAYGGIWVLIVSIVSDWFGTQNFGKHYGVIAMGPALSGMLFNSASAWIYERHAISGNDSNDVCVGTACYRGAFVLTGCAAVLSSVLLVCLSSRRNGSKS
ncbi:hypothetical protein ACA910_021141 [Epithemia clementina (nom. ined.)]